MRFVWFLFALLCLSFQPAQAQSLEPHLGYGIHLDPNVPVDPQMVEGLGMDWVKLYTDSQISLFPNKRILFRQDMDYPSDWAAFRIWLTERVRFLDNQGVEAIEIHNEPNLSMEWNDQPPNARQYVEMLRNSYEVVKAVAPRMIVVSGGLAPTITTPDRMAITDIDYAREMLQNGAAQWFDAFGYHPYGYNAPPEEAPAYGKLNFRRTELIWALFREYGISNKQIWLTEFGWLRDPSEDGVTCSDSDPEFAGFAWLRVDGQTQADYIVRAFQYADRNWAWAGPTFLWNLNFSSRPNDGSLDMCSHIRWFGLLRTNGEKTLAFERVANMPKRYSRYLPVMVLYADEMTLETARGCTGQQEVGEFIIGNTGYPGAFSASIEAAQALIGPQVQTSASSGRSGQRITVYAETSHLEPGFYVLYINVRANIGGEIRAQNLRGFVILRESGACS